jgi:hypothetical protein
MLGFGRMIWLYCLEVLDHFQSSGIDPTPLAGLRLARGLLFFSNLSSGYRGHEQENDEKWTV